MYDHLGRPVSRDRRVQFHILVLDLIVFRVEVYRPSRYQILTSGWDVFGILPLELGNKLEKLEAKGTNFLFVILPKAFPTTLLISSITSILRLNCDFFNNKKWE